jgi:hypothetical protein
MPPPMRGGEEKWEGDLFLLEEAFRQIFFFRYGTVGTRWLTMTVGLYLWWEPPEIGDTAWRSLRSRRGYVTLTKGR